MFRRIALLVTLPMLSVASASAAQEKCVACQLGNRGEPELTELLRERALRPVPDAPLPRARPLPVETERQNNGNGRGGGNRGNGNGNGGGNGDGGGNGGGGGGNGGGRTDGGGDGSGCGNGQGGGNGNGTKGNGNGQACGDGTVPEIFIQNEIDFGRLILLGGGASSVLLDLETGQKITMGNLDDYGGVSMVGRATVTGRPNSEVNVTFPDRITMRDPRGGIAELREFTTSLPLVARLDNSGVLEFTFTGRLALTETIGEGGNLRGQVPITVEYN